MVDWFTKVSHLLSCTKNINIQAATYLIICEVLFRHHVLPYEIIGDQGLEISKYLVAKSRLVPLQEVHIAHSRHLQDARATHKKFRDCHCLNLSTKGPYFRLGNHVWLLHSNIKPIQPQQVGLSMSWSICYHRPYTWSCVSSWSPSYMSSPSVLRITFGISCFKYSGPCGSSTSYRTCCWSKTRGENHFGIQCSVH